MITSNLSKIFTPESSDRFSDLPYITINTVPYPSVCPSVGYKLNLEPIHDLLTQGQHDNGVNVTSLADVQAHFHKLPEHYRQKMAILDSKARKGRLNHIQEFAEQSRVIALGESLACLRLINCCTNIGRCNKDRLCKVCAGLKARDLVEKWYPAFERTSWIQVTISYEGFLGFSGPSTSAWIRHWDAAAFAVKNANKAGLIWGAIAREELAVHSVKENDLPTFHVKPHVHYLVPIDQAVPDELKERLAEHTLHYRDENAWGISSIPHVDIKSLASSEDVARSMTYIHKPIDLVHPYRESFADLMNPTEAFFGHLNRQMRDLVEAILAGTYKRQMTRYRGVAQDKSPYYLLTPDTV